MSPEDFPAVVVDILDLSIGASKEWNAVLIPWGVIVEVLGGEGCGVESTLRQWRGKDYEVRSSA